MDSIARCGCDRGCLRSDVHGVGSYVFFWFIPLFIIVWVFAVYLPLPILILNGGGPSRSVAPLPLLVLVLGCLAGWFVGWLASNVDVACVRACVRVCHFAIFFMHLSLSGYVFPLFFLFFFEQGIIYTCLLWLCSALALLCSIDSRYNLCCLVCRV
jgi:hypothetical protein